MKVALIDTDILSEFFRGNPKVVEKAGNYLMTYDALNISIITFYEILNGLLYKDAKKQLNKLTESFDLIRVLTLTLRAARLAAEIYADLRKKGETIGHTDSLIAELL